jgi:bifunctional UDP-N-acetylglucosamine pyrophosphorylase/glucosamine-1-phosphate N-acetyltransferase
MVSYVIETLRAAEVQDIAIVVGHGAAEVMRALGDDLAYVRQDEQKGSGDAVRSARDRFEGFEGALVVVCGDSPLFRAETVRAMIDAQRSSQAAAVLASATLDDPTGYGRIVRDKNGAVSRIVEESCASAEHRAIKEINGGAYVFDSLWLFGNINWMVRNLVGEYNLTDMARLAIEQGKCVTTVQCDPEEVLGINTPEELGFAESIMRQREP